LCSSGLRCAAARACINASSVGLFRRDEALRNHLFQTWLSGRTRPSAAQQRKEWIMLGWALTFLVVALIAAVLGFGGIAGLSIEIAKIIFFVAIVLFLISAVIGLLRGRSPTVS
jgi:uncharacterized membrane protein YtjA (UPF0391 family)